MEDDVPDVKPMGTLFAAYAAKIQPTKATERGELLRYFSKKLAISVPYVGYKLKGMQDLQTLYHIKSDCDQAESRGIPWGAAFHTSIKPRPSQPAASLE